MLTVTEDAKALCAAILNQAEAPDSAVMRIVAEDKGLGLVADEVKDTDETFEVEGKTVLVVEPALAEQLADRKLSAIETEQGPQLSLG